MEYDVFISCKSEDYKLAEEVYHYLKLHDINSFLSSTELRKLKDSEYIHAISEALDSAYHLIVLSSSKENTESKWVKFEWTTFLNEVLSGRKEGQIMTLLDGMKIEDLPVVLRHYESFTPNDYKSRILPYVETPAFLQRKKEKLEKNKKEAEEVKKQQEAEKIKIKEEIQRKESEYQQYSSYLEVIENDIIKRYKEIGVLEKICPVCDKQTSIDSMFCKTCGHSFHPLFPTENSNIGEQLLIQKSIFHNHSKSVKQIEELKAQLIAEKETAENLKKDLSELKKNWSDAPINKYTELDNKTLINLALTKDKYACQEIAYRYYTGTKGMKQSVAMANNYLRKADLPLYKEDGKPKELPLSLCFKLNDEKLYMVLSPDKKYYIGNIKAENKDFNWLDDSWLAIGGTSLVAGAFFMGSLAASSVIAILLKSIGSWFSESESDKQKNTSIDVVDFCRKLSKENKYIFDVPTEAETIGVEENLKKYCIIIRIKDNPQLINNNFQ